MEINVFKDSDKSELSMIEVAHAILSQKADVMDFSDLVNQIQTYLGKSDGEIRDSLAQFYTDLNIDGSFISLGDNRWGLRSWYAIDSIDEEINHGLEDEEDEDKPKRKKRKKVNAFITGDEDAIDYNDDDPEDTDLADEDDDELFEDEDDDDEEIKAYNSDLQEIGADKDDEEELDGSIEEELTIIDDEDLEDDEDDEEYNEEEE